MPTIGLPWPELNDGIIYRDIVSLADSGLTLIQYYTSKHKSSAPLQGWLQRIRNGQIKVDGIIVNDSNITLREGSKLEYHRLPWREPDAPYLLEVLYEDDEMIALNKPSGLQVLPGGLFQQRTVLTQLQRCGTGEGGKECHPVPVHRLGRGTSGVLLCAKTKRAKVQLASYFADGTSAIRDKNLKGEAEKKITKTYRALASGVINAEEIDVKQPIGVVHYPGVAKGLYVASPTGKPALSKIRVLEKCLQRNRTLVEVVIQSGRPHQIRIHLSFIGHTLLGDPLYADGGQPNIFSHEAVDQSFAQDGGYERPSNPVPGDCGYCLHAHHVRLVHPSTNEVMIITAPLPPELKTIKGEPIC